MRIPPTGSTLTLTHYGRRSSKPYELTIWFTEIDGDLWIGSLDCRRNWVRNLRANGRCCIDFGDGPQEVRAEFRGSADDVERHRRAVLAKYPLLARLIGLFAIGKQRAAFRLVPPDSGAA